MPPIYISSKLASGKAQSPDYSVRELDGKTTGRYSEHHYVGIPEEIQPCYAEYVANLPAFMTATAVQSRVVCGKTYKPSLGLEYLLPLRLPGLAIAPVTPYEKIEDEQRWLQPLNNIEYTTITYNKKKSFIISEVQTSQLATYPKTNPRVPCSNNVVNKQALTELLTTIKLITLFITTHSYAAFQTESETGARFKSSMDIHLENPLKAKSGSRWIESEYPEEFRKTRAETFVLGGPAEIDAYPTKHSFDRAGGILVAKPAPLYPSINYGGPSTIPNLPGFAFPYFRGMALSSRDMIVDIVRQYFVPCFGMNETTQQQNWRTWASTVEHWCQTETGRAVGHILFCMRTAIEAQGRLFVVVHNKNYYGCAVLGFKFNIAADGILLVPDTNVNVRKHIRKMDEHAIALEGICETLRGLAIRGQEDVDLTAEINVSSARQLLLEIQRREEPEVGDDFDEFIEKVNSLSFEQSFWRTGHNSIIQALQALTLTELPEWLADAPCHFDSTTVYDRSKENMVLSAFGPTAPSFLDQNGTYIKIPEGTRAEDPQSEVLNVEQATKLLMPTIFVTMKKLKVACNDMKSVFKNRKIKQRGNEFAGGYRTIAFVGEPRDQIWNALKCVPWEVKKTAAGGKRKAIEGPDDEPGSKKGKEKAKGPVVDEDFGNFDF